MTSGGETEDLTTRQRQVYAQLATERAARTSERTNHLKCRPSFTPNSLVAFQGS
jgi:hypothetical protein